MLNDIFATTMGGRYQTERSGQVVERGDWSYRGYGDAEITMTASAELESANLRYELRIHSVERQIDEFFIRVRRNGDPLHDLRAIVAGHTVTISAHEASGDQTEGTITVPPETVYDGPSPIWLIHLAMTAPPPPDREVTTPCVRLDAESGEFFEGFYRVSRNGPTIKIIVLDKEGAQTDVMVVSLAEDGCPRRLQSGTAETEVLRIPQAVGV